MFTYYGALLYNLSTKCIRHIKHMRNRISNVIYHNSQCIPRFDTDPDKLN
jgi:hypothetical protein